MPRTIGLLGGTLNPVHEGHLSIAREAMRLFGLDGVWFIPCAVPPHKPTHNLASNEDRLAMLQLAIAGESRFAALPIELVSAGKEKHFQRAGLPAAGPDARSLPVPR